MNTRKKNPTKIIILSCIIIFCMALAGTIWLGYKFITSLQPTKLIEYNNRQYELSDFQKVSKEIIDQRDGQIVDSGQYFSNKPIYILRPDLNQDLTPTIIYLENQPDGFVTYVLAGGP